MKFTKINGKSDPSQKPLRGSTNLPVWDSACASRNGGAMPTLLLLGKVTAIAMLIHGLRAVHRLRGRRGPRR